MDNPETKERNTVPGPMEFSESTVTLAAKLYGARDTMRRLWGSEFPRRIRPYCEVIKRAMAKTGKSELPAAIGVVEQLNNVGASAILQLQIWAACVEMVEPSKASSMEQEGNEVR